jgi:hypothetical protein
MVLAIDGGSLAAGVVGVVVLVTLAIFGAFQLRGWLAARRLASEEAAAFHHDGRLTITDPLLFGGGARAVEVRDRRDAVAYGYLAVAEEFVPVDGGAGWCTLTVNLPGRVPFLSVDRVGTVGPAGTTRVGLSDPEFEAVYQVHAPDSETVALILSDLVRAVLLGSSLVQRLMLREAQLLLRAPDGSALSAETVAELERVAREFLSAVPSFVTHDLTGRPLAMNAAPLPPGLYGPEEADETSASSALG